MNSRALTVPLLVCLILGSYVVIVEQVQATASPSLECKRRLCFLLPLRCPSRLRIFNPIRQMGNSSPERQMCAPILTLIPKRMKALRISAVIGRKKVTREALG